MIFALVLTALILVSSLVCFHQWQPASCETAEICLKCEKVRAPALGHNWVDATCTQSKTCATCQKTEGDPLGHDWQRVNCEEPEECTRCQEKKTEAAGHIWQDATCEKAQICTICNQQGQDALGHSWMDATCEEAKHCTTCGITQGQPLEHSFCPATCAAPETCALCGVTQGEPLPHDWADATCIAPKTCTQCSATEGTTVDHNWEKATCTAPRTCATCKMTEGSAPGHKWVEATCTSPKTCKVCGATSGIALGHTFEDNTDGTDRLCTVCGRSVSTKYVALTFDDGPSGSLSLKLLDELDKRGVKSTFFVCGYRIKSFPDVPQQVLDRGHELALHTSTHANLTKLSAKQIRKELQDTLDLLPEGANVTLMRPPGGNYNSKVRSVCADMGLSVILWSLDTRDWATDNADTVVQKIVNNVKDGDIILMHELKSMSVEAALQAIDILQAQGYVFVTVSQLAEIQGKTLVSGNVYCDLK